MITLDVGAIKLLRRYPTLLAWYGPIALSGIMLYSLAVFLPATSQPPRSP